MGALADRETFTKQQMDSLQLQLKDAHNTLEGKACVYATGSYGRGEAGPHSDLDLFIVGKRDSRKEKNLLSPLDEICVKADLIGATRSLGIREFDGDGRYLLHYSTEELVDTLGKPEDDLENTFTARLLLLLESQPLLESDVHAEAIETVLAAYWQDYEDHKDDFQPVFLCNDILRLWRTFCVNYECRTQREPEEKNLKRRIKNYKLKYSRMLTCYSALIFMLHTYNNNKTVSTADAVTMAELSPLKRLARLAQEADAEAKPAFSSLIENYGNFLEVTNTPEEKLMEIFADSARRAPLNEAAYEFGDEMFNALKLVGKDGRFHRMLVI